MKAAELRAPVLVIVLALSIAGCGGRSAGPGSQYRAVQAGVAFEMLRDNPDLIVLDLRPFSEYSSPGGHLQRAVSVPVEELEALWPTLDLSTEDTVLLYNNDGGTMQVNASATMLERGLRYVVQIEGGLDAWVARGFPVQVEDAPLSPLRPQGGSGAAPQ